MNGVQYIDEVVLVANGSTYNYYMSDLRYSVYGFLDASGAVVERAKYDGYGKRTLMNTTYTTIGTSVVAQPCAHTGQRLDSESGLQYYRARYFDNDLGRFISRDPIGYVDGLNFYRGYFVQKGVDPEGTLVLVLPEEGHGGLSFSGNEEPTLFNANINSNSIKEFFENEKDLAQKIPGYKSRTETPTGITRLGDFDIEPALKNCKEDGNQKCCRFKVGVSSGSIQYSWYTTPPNEGK